MLKKAKVKSKNIKNKTSQIPSSIEITHPEKILYPASKITKQDLINYYDSIKDWMLPYVINRPLTLVRCPSGINGSCFFQKHLNEITSQFLYEIPIKEKHSTTKYIYIKDIKGIIQLVQLSVLEIHFWNCHISNIEKPDLIIFDLDPAPNLSWKKVIKSAFFVKEQLEELNLISFLKTSGHKGLHIVIPVTRRYDWDTIKAFSKSFAETLALKKPDDFVANMAKAKRSDKIFVDYLRNQRGATAVAPYSTRAKEYATVSVPIRWEELSSRIKPNSFTIRNLPKRLSMLNEDPWEELLKIKQGLNIKLIESFFS